MKFAIQVPIVVRGVKVYGPRGFRAVDLVLDTGSIFTVLSSPVLRLIGYEPADAEKQIGVVTAGGIVDAFKIRVDRVSVAELEVPEFDVLCMDIVGLPHIDGLLGLDFLKHFRTVIDFRKGIVEISRF
mgnify:CR=1 FL=1